MKETFTAVIKQPGDWWIGWIEEVPGVNCQEATREELLESLRLTLREALEFKVESRRPKSAPVPSASSQDAATRLAEPVPV